MHKLNTWVKGSWNTNGSYLSSRRPKTKWARKVHILQLKKMCQEVAYVMQAKRAPVQTSHSLLKCNAGPKRKTFQGPSESADFCASKSTLVSPFISFAKPEEQMRKKENKTMLGLLLSSWDLTTKPPSSQANRLCCPAFALEFPRNLWELKPRPWVLGDLSYHALAPKHAHKIVNTTPRRKWR